MKIDLEQGAYLEIGGELGKYNSLPIDTLIKIAQDFQDLILTVAKFDLPSNEPIDPKNFKLELVGFSTGSAVPKFAYTQRSENKTGLYWQVHRNTVNEKVDKLIELSNSGDYGQLKVIYPEPIKRNPIVETLFLFANSFGSAPVNFVDVDEQTNTITPLYKVNHFKPALKDSLIAEFKEVYNESQSDETLAKVKITSKDGKVVYRKIIDTYSSNLSLEYAPMLIISGDTKYVLKYPLRCLFEKENDYFIIQSEMLGIIGTGLTQEEAENSFNEEFDYIYNRLISLDDDKLTNHNQLAKSILAQIIEKIEQ